MKKPELQEIPENSSIKLVLSITSNNQRALIRYNDYLEKQVEIVKEYLGDSMDEIVRLNKLLLKTAL